MTRPRLLLALLTIAGVVAIAGCGSGGHSATSGATRRASTTSAQDQRAATAAEFAGAYVRFLDGAGTAAALPDATMSVRALAGQAGPVPAARRRGTLVLAAAARRRKASRAATCWRPATPRTPSTPRSR